MESLIFVVDSEPESCELLRNCLEQAGFAVRAFSQHEANLAGLESPALIIFGLHPKNHSVFLTKSFEKVLSDDIPRIVVTDGNSPELQLTALNFSANEWISRPFAPHQLVLRVRALLRRSKGVPESIDDRAAEIVIDSWAMKLSVRGNEVITTALEFRLLEYLARHRGQVFTRDFLLDAVWGEIRFVNPRSVDACIRRIREKIESDPNNPTMLKTVRGVGYRLDARTVWQAEPTVVCDCPACRTKVIDPRWNLLGAKQRRASAEN